MSDDSELGEIETDHAAELQDIVRSVARLRRWSRFSVLWIVAACLCVFGAILFAGTRGAAPGVIEHQLSYRPTAAAIETAELQRENDQLQRENDQLRRENDELRRENDELRRENDELKRVAELESRGAAVSTGAAVPTAAVDAKPDARATDKSPDSPSPPAPSVPPPVHSPVHSGQTGLILVRVKHAWAQVTIDGEDAGTTPVRASVTSGVHKVLLVGVGEGHREQLTVTVPDGGQSVIERNW